MANERLLHDAALAMALASLGVVAPCLREEERLDALDEFYMVCKAGIEAYEVQLNRMQMRLNPTRN